MKKLAQRITCALVGVLLAALFLPASANAAHLEGKKGWTATYKADGKMDETYPDNNKNSFADTLSHLQPGDDMTFTVKAVHANDKAADWYVSNEILKSLEADGDDAEGSKYSYEISWKGPKQSRVLYTSERVGGDNTSGKKEDEGLNEATNALDDYIFLERMSKGDEGAVTVKVALDGETEGNAYFDTLAQLRVRFAVEPVTSDNKRNNKNNTIEYKSRGTVKTGDETRLFPLYVAMVVSGGLLMALVVKTVREEREERKGVRK